MRERARYDFIPQYPIGQGNSEARTHFRTLEQLFEYFVFEYPNWALLIVRQVRGGSNIKVSV